jgi:hypothetical protein
VSTSVSRGSLERLRAIVSSVEELYDSRIKRIFRADGLKSIFLDHLLEDFRYLNWPRTPRHIDGPGKSDLRPRSTRSGPITGLQRKQGKRELGPYSRTPGVRHRL